MTPCSAFRNSIPSGGEPLLRRPPAPRRQPEARSRTRWNGLRKRYARLSPRWCFRPGVEQPQEQVRYRQRSLARRLPERRTVVAAHRYPSCRRFRLPLLASGAPDTKLSSGGTSTGRTDRLLIPEFNAVTFRCCATRSYRTSAGPPGLLQDAGLAQLPPPEQPGAIRPVLTLMALVRVRKLRDRPGHTRVIPQCVSIADAAARRSTISALAAPGLRCGPAGGFTKPDRARRAGRGNDLGDPVSARGTPGRTGCPARPPWTSGRRAGRSRGGLVALGVEHPHRAVVFVVPGGGAPVRVAAEQVGDGGRTRPPPPPAGKARRPPAGPGAARPRSSSSPARRTAWSTTAGRPSRAPARGRHVRRSDVGPGRREPGWPDVPRSPQRPGGDDGRLVV